MATDGVEEGTLGTKEESWFWCPGFPNTPVMVEPPGTPSPRHSWHPTGAYTLGPYQTTCVSS